MKVLAKAALPKEQVEEVKQILKEDEGFKRYIKDNPDYTEEDEILQLIANEVIMSLGNVAIDIADPEPVISDESISIEVELYVYSKQEQDEIKEEINSILNNINNIRSINKSIIKIKDILNKGCDHETVISNN